MWKIWYSIFDPRRALIAKAIFLGALMFTIHLILLSTDRYNWLDGARTVKKAEGVTTSQPAKIAAHLDLSKLNG